MLLPQGDLALWLAAVASVGFTVPDSAPARHRADVDALAGDALLDAAVMLELIGSSVGSLSGLEAKGRLSVLRDAAVCNSSLAAAAELVLAGVLCQPHSLARLSKHRRGTLVEAAIYLVHTRYAPVAGGPPSGDEAVRALARWLLATASRRAAASCVPKTSWRWWRKTRR